MSGQYDCNFRTPMRDFGNFNYDDLPGYGCGCDSGFSNQNIWDSDANFGNNSRMPNIFNQQRQMGYPRRQGNGGGALILGVLGAFTLVSVLGGSGGLKPVINKVGQFLGKLFGAKQTEGLDTGNETSDTDNKGGKATKAVRTEVVKDANGNEKSVTEFDESGNRIKKTTHQADKTKCVLEYNKDGKTAICNIYDENDNLKSSNESEVDKDGRLTKSTATAPDGTKRVYTNEYKEDGTMIQTTYQADGKTPKEINIIGKDELVVATTQYDENGKETSTIKFDKDGKEIKAETTVETPANTEKAAPANTEKVPPAKKEEVAPAAGDDIFAEGVTQKVIQLPDKDGKTQHIVTYRNKEDKIIQKAFVENGTTTKIVRYNKDESRSSSVQLKGGDDVATKRDVVSTSTIKVNENGMDITTTDTDGKVTTETKDLNYDSKGNIISISDINDNGITSYFDFDHNTETGSSTNDYYGIETKVVTENGKTTVYNWDSTKKDWVEKKPE